MITYFYYYYCINNNHKNSFGNNIVYNTNAVVIYYFDWSEMACEVLCVCSVLGFPLTRQKLFP